MHRLYNDNVKCKRKMTLLRIRFARVYVKSNSNQANEREQSLNLVTALFAFTFVCSTPD